MKNRCLIAACFVLAAAAAAWARPNGDVIDRIVALVNGHVILQSHLEDNVYFEAFSEGRPVREISDRDRGAALAHLIDQELVREQVPLGENTAATPADVQKRIAEIRALHPSATSDDAWRAELARYGLDEKRFEARVAEQLAVLRQVDLRLRPTVQVETSEIETYYRNTFLPELRQVGAADVPLPEVSSRIREILTQQKIGESFTTWLQSLRKESKIRSPIPVEDLPAGGSASR